MIRRIGKRGEDTLMKNVLSVVIFALSFALIIYGIYKVYNVFQNQETKNARDTLDKISSKIEALKTGEKTVLTIQGFKNSQTWRLVSWSKKDTSDTKPDNCYFKSCICLCKATSHTVQGDLDDCKKNNICKTFDYEEISIIKSTNTPLVFAGTASYLCFPESIAEIEIDKKDSENKIIIQYSQDTGNVQCYQ